MKNTATNTANQNSSNAILVMMLVMLLLSSVAMFSQNTATVQEVTATSNVLVSDDATTASVSATTESNSNMSMVSWFMGTKQTPNANGAQAAPSSKKQMINSGIAPNRLLMKAFLKKAANYQSTIA